MFEEPETTNGPVADADDELVDETDFEDEDEFAGDGDGAEFDEDAVATAADGPPGPASEGLQRLVHFLAVNLVDDPEGVVVDAEQRGQLVSLTLRVPEEELGKVIGRQGRIARAMRTVLTIAGSRQNVRASLDIEG
jgi:predicted RNA-binding protein YlqC (UPF0109 family)